MQSAPQEAITGDRELTRGQVSAEAITAAIIVVLFMVGVLASNWYMARQVSFLKDDAAQANDCGKLVSAIILVGSVPGNAKIETAIRSDANISRNTISFGAAFCTFSGAQISANLDAGEVRVSKVSGVVSVENV